MNKFMLAIFMLLSAYTVAETHRSIYMNKIPRECSAKYIIREFPYIKVLEPFSEYYPDFQMLEVIDVVNVKTIQYSKNKLECSAELITSKNNSRTYRITFTKNSIGQILVSH